MVDKKKDAKVKESSQKTDKSKGISTQKEILAKLEKTGKPVNKERIVEKLMEVIDPELGMNIVDLGLVYEVEVLPKGENNLQKVIIKMTFTTPACPMINDMLNEIQSRLEEIDGLDVDLAIVFDPPWTPDKMSDRAKIKLGLI